MEGDSDEEINQGAGADSGYQILEFRVPVHLEDLELPKQDRYCVTEPLSGDELEDTNVIDTFSGTI